MSGRGAVVTFSVRGGGIDDCVDHPASQRRNRRHVGLDAGCVSIKSSSSFSLVRLRDDFGVDLVAMGWLLSLATYAKLAGNVTWGVASDRWGRRPAFMIGIIWFSVASGLTGLAWSYASLLAIRILFGFGFGGEWSASASLLMETVPAKARSLASAIMMSG